ncbi:MAG: hypothetical protein HY656_06810 [Acidobacteria bacterium]|nr:hypothetical protein [Acidobacteriota bacterium]
MRRLFTAALLVALVAVLAASSLWAKTHSFKLFNDATINGTELGPGTYKLELNGQNEAVISRGGEVVVKARVETRPTKGTDQPGSVLRAADGSIREIRLNSLVVVFVR